MGKVNWDDSALLAACNAAARPVVTAKTLKTAATANAMGAGFRTGLYHRDHRSPAVGDTSPRYECNVERHGSLDVGIVYTGNYSAMRDNHLHNTLLKARG